ncbi:MAG: hydratase [Eubacteriales bacterium]
MIKLHDEKTYLLGGTQVISATEYEKTNPTADPLSAKKGTIAYDILTGHNTSGNEEKLKIKFDAMTSHDITFVSIIQTAKASGMEKFPLPYVLTNCHNSLCAVGGTINEDDHIFGLTSAKKYGGIYVPPHMAVIHQYMREMAAGCGKMILGSDSHTRYGALGTLAMGEGGGELVKQLLEDTYDIDYPDVIGVNLTGKVRPGVGPHDIALAIIGAVFSNGFVKNKVMEFVGDGITAMSTDFRNSIDVMTTETTCLSSIWRTDGDTKAYLTLHGRGGEYKELNPKEVALYDGMIEVDLDKVKPMIALPFHPSNTYTIEAFKANLGDILRSVEKEAEILGGGKLHDFCLTDKIVDGNLLVQQGIIAGCAGGNFDNMMEASHILKSADCGNDIFSLAMYPSSQAVQMELTRNGAVADILSSGATMKTAFCGPCFGAGDTPSNNAFSIRHTTRNFPNREGSKPMVGQMSAVALMDARSIAATAAKGGMLCSAEEVVDGYTVPDYHFDGSIYAKRVYQGYGKAKLEEDVVYGPNIKDWPTLSPLGEHILLKVCSKIMDEVTTTDELIPSGETSSYRSNPLGLAEFTLSRRDPEYVGKSKLVRDTEDARREGKDFFATDEKLKSIYDTIKKHDSFKDLVEKEVEIGSMLYAVKPGDGSAREQAASCQRVLGGLANIAQEYATKRYRSNVMNWGMIPFQMADLPEFQVGDYIFIPDIRKTLGADMSQIKAFVVGAELKEITLSIANMTQDEVDIVKAGCLINHSKNKRDLA